MSKNFHGGTAFPTNARDVDSGMALRDYFAAAAMQGYIAAGGQIPSATIAEKAYQQADKMLEERQK